jgi:hypothetical protein
MSLVPAALLALSLIPTRLPDDVQPRAFASPNGETLLHVLPSGRRGSGSSTLVLTKAGVLRWEREVPVTFVEAAVHESGAAVGFALPDGRPLPSCMGPGSQRQVLGLVTPEGSFRVLHEWVAQPRRAQVGLVTGEDIALVHVGSLWWRIELTVPGAALEALPHGPYAEPGFAPEGALWPRDPEDVLVSGTPLRIVTSGDHAVLVDARRKPVWSRSFTSPAVGACWIPGVFVIGSGERYRGFRVEHAGGWRVHELSSEELSSELNQPALPAPAAPSRSIPLEDVDQATRKGRTSSALVDAWGRTVILRRDPDRLLVFDASGARLHDVDLETRPGWLRYPTHHQELTLGPAGAVRIDFGRDGAARVQTDGRLTFEAGPLPSQLLALVPGSDTRWILRRGELRFVDALGRSGARGLRRPDGQWIGYSSTLSAAADGSLAVLDGEELHVYGPNRAPRGTWTVSSSGLFGVPPAFDGRRAAWLESDAVRWIDTESGRSGCIQRTRAQTEPRTGMRDAAIAWVQGSLWVVNVGSLRVDVFEIP